MSASISKLTGAGNYFEDFEVGAKLRHARGTTIGEIENQMLTKLVLNTADSHYNEHRMRSTQFGQRLVFVDGNQVHLAGLSWRHAVRLQRSS
jgi:acyl dehydratase